MNFPKKIWIDELFYASQSQCLSYDTPYIRADLVDELVVALQHARIWAPYEQHCEYIQPRIEAALAKIKEEG